MRKMTGREKKHENYLRQEERLALIEQDNKKAKQLQKLFKEAMLVTTGEADSLP